MSYVKIGDVEYIELIQWQALKDGVPYIPDTDIEVDIYDYEGTLRYTLDMATVPTIIVDETTKTCSIRKVDVSNFPDGDVAIHWKAYIDGVECKKGTAFPWVQTIPFSRSLEVPVDDLDIYNKKLNVYVGQPYDFYPVIIKADGERFDPYDLQMLIYDEENELVATLGETKISTGVYKFTWDVPDSQTVGYYKFAIQAKGVEDDEWLQVAHPFNFAISTGPTHMYIERRQFASSEDVVEVFYRIYDFCPKGATTAVKQEIINRACRAAHHELMSMMGARAALTTSPALKVPEAYLAASMIIMASQGVRKADMKLAQEFRKKGLEMAEATVRAFSGTFMDIRFSV